MTDGVRPGAHGEHLAELVKCRREREATELAIERVRSLHQPDMYGYCEACAGVDGKGISWPDCPTTRALDAPPMPTEEGS